jgi:glycosyltransferase involved in cell wall biosynthesis
MYSLNGKRILHYTAYDNLPGAAKSAYNIHNTFKANGADSTMIVLQKKSEDSSVIEVTKGFPYYLQTGIELVRRIIFPKADSKSSFNRNRRLYFSTDSLFPEKDKDADAIFIYWINNYLNTALQQKIFDHYKCPVIWVLMDMEPITGGCHQSMGCERYTVSCGSCPILNSTSDRDLSNRTWLQKKKLNDRNNVTYVAPTKGLLEQVQKSSLAINCRIEYIPLAVETEVYRPVQKFSARDVINIPMDRIVLFFGANNIRSIYKGAGYLEEALNAYYARLLNTGKKDIASRILLLLAGGNRGGLFKKTPFDVLYLDRCKDIRTMALAFQSSDVYVCPSIYDGGPVMIPEAMMCGTPVVAFDTGGATDLIRSGVNGYIAEYMNSEDFALGIEIVVDKISSGEMRALASSAAQNENTPEIVAERYCHLLESILAT